VRKARVPASARQRRATPERDQLVPVQHADPERPNGCSSLLVLLPKAT
jgi:hypothetical protein